MIQSHYSLMLGILLLDDKQPEQAIDIDEDFLLDSVRPLTFIWNDMQKSTPPASRHDRPEESTSSERSKRK